MKATTTYFKSVGEGWPEHEYFKHGRKDVAIFQNILGTWTAEGAFRQVVADSKEGGQSRHTKRRNKLCPTLPR